MRPDHMNVELLGNVVKHIHWHIVPRYQNAPRWGGPIWTTRQDEMLVTTLPATEQNAIVGQIRDALSTQ